MKILITGIGGFVGTNLSESLRIDGHEVFGLGRKSGEAGAQFSWEDVDAGTLPKVDVVIHLAGKAHDLKNRASAQVYFDINVGLTQKIFKWFEASDAQQFYFFSSVKAAADFVPGEILTEDIVPAPVGPYGESKIAAENFLRARFDFNSDGNALGGKRVYILRPCMIHGRGNKGNLNLLYAVVRRGLPWPLGAFENKRSFLSIANLEFIIKKMLAGTPVSGIYNLSDDDALSTNELVATICETLGKRARIVNFPASLMRFAANAGTVLRLPFNKERLNKLTENYVVSNEKIRKAIGEPKLPVSVRDGIAQTIKAFRENSQPAK